MSDFIGDPAFRIRRGKPCPCEWCGERIETGTEYATYPQVWEGQFSQMRMHAECYTEGYCALDWHHYDYEFETQTMARGEPMSKEGAV